MATPEDMERDTINKPAINPDLERKQTMNGTFRNLSALAIAFSMSMAAVPANSQGKGKSKAKGKQDVETKDKHGRAAGELPFGLEQYSDNKGELPSGLQKTRNDDGSLTRGLKEGGKRLTSGNRSKKKLK